MPNAIDMAVAALAHSLQLAANTSLRIRRGGEKSEAINATLTIATYEVLDEELGFPIRVQSSDWVILKSLIAINGASIELRPGDELLTLAGGRYEVMPLGKRPCVEPHDAAGALVIVHTKDLSCRT
jgi:hypothetical protein